MPLSRRDGSFFGTLCALDSQSALLSESQLELFRLLADLISFQLETEEKHAQRAVALLDAQQTAELRERFIGVLGHDLRNPLNAITLTAQALLRMEELGERPTQLARRIAASTERIARMVNDLLDFTRGRLGGGIPISVARCDAAALLGQVLEELQVAHPDRRIAFEGGQSQPVDWDAARMGQVLSNLVGNALAHSPPQSAVDLRLSGTDDEVVIETHNFGQPIASERLSRIFEPFERTAPAGERSGLGLGLYIAREIVQAHGGGLSARSSEAEGTTFTVRMPRHVPG